MKTETLKGKIETAYGKVLDKAVDYTTDIQLFENIDELKAANAMPSNDDLVDMVNSRRKNNARQSAMAEALKAAGIEKPTLENSPELRFKSIVDALVAAGKSQAEAEGIAKASLGL